MTFVDSIIDTQGFLDALTDQRGQVVKGKGGLITRGMTDCICVILSDRKGTYGIVHISPECTEIVQLIKDLKKRVGKPVVAIVAGGNTGFETQSRLNALQETLSDLDIIDETVKQNVPRTLRVKTGPFATNNVGKSAGVAIVDASLDRYTLLDGGAYAMQLINNPGSYTSKSSKRSGGCTIV